MRELFQKIKNILINPSDEFSIIARSELNIIAINKRFLVPLSGIISLFFLVSSSITNIASPATSFIYIFFNAIILFLIVLTHSYVSGKIITLIGQNMHPVENSINYYALTIYSQLPFYIILAIVKLFPSLVFLSFLGLYSGLLFYTGTRKLIKIPEEKRIRFTLLSMLIMMISFILFSQLFTILYDEIIEQFSTFAAR
ncbi:YIP1 family protein [Bacteroidota bacterium]